MITDMVNLGPPLKAMPDLKASNRRPEDKPVEEAPGSFEQVLSEKTAEKLSRGLPDKGKSPISKNAQKVTGEPTKMAVDTQTDKNKDDDQKSSEVSPNTKESVEAKNLGVKTNLSERQKVMQKFMDSIESEFSIPPERVVEAMAQLSDKELLLSPEETATQVIAKLDLDPVESEKAEAMYLAMVTQLSGTLPQVRDPQPLQPQTKAFLNGALAGGGMAAVLAAQERRQILNDSLERMNSKFFLKPEVKLPTEVADLPTQDLGVEGLYNRTEMKPQFSETLETRPASLQDIRPLLARQDMDPKVAQKLGEFQSQMKPVKEQISTAELRDALAAMGVTAATIDQALKNDPQNGQALKMEKSMFGDNADMMMAAPVTAGFAGAALMGKEHQDSGQNGDGGKQEAAKNFLNRDPSLAAPSKVSTGSEFVMPSIATQQAAPAPHQMMGAVAGAGAAGATPTKAAADEVNIQAVMKQAQYMIKKGGGEATVQMNPEGMGQVHLKVMVSEGRVNLELKTESNEAKKLIESNLGDLKASLSIHKLAVDHVKVDVNNQLSSNSDQQRSNDQGQFKQDPGREQARQFFNQFRQDNLDRREGFYETPGVKAYSRTKPVEPLKPGDEGSSLQTRRYKGAGKGSGLDLVA